jgi:hypothetical protein
MEQIADRGKQVVAWSLLPGCGGRWARGLLPEPSSGVIWVPSSCGEMGSHRQGTAGSFCSYPVNTQCLKAWQWPMSPLPFCQEADTMKDVLLPGLALAAAHAGDLDTLQAFVELVSSPLRDQASGWDAAHTGRTPSPGVLTNAPKPHWAMGPASQPQGLAGRWCRGGPVNSHPSSPLGGSPDLS